MDCVPTIVDGGEAGCQAIGIRVVAQVELSSADPCIFWRQQRQTCWPLLIFLQFGSVRWMLCDAGSGIHRSFACLCRTKDRAQDDSLVARGPMESLFQTELIPESARGFISRLASHCSSSSPPSARSRADARCVRI